MGKVIARAATSTLSLVVAGASAVGTAATGSWLVAAIGGITYTALVAWDVASPRPPDSKLPAPRRYTHPEIAQAMTALRRGRDELDRVMREAPDAVQGYMGLALTSLTELESHATKLAERGEEMAAYLARVDPQAVRGAIARLDEQIRTARDAEAKTQYQNARTAREEQLRTLEEIGTALERVLANLSRIIASVEGLPARVMKMQVLDAEAMDSISGDLNAELDRMNGEVRAFEETLANVPLGVTA